eukprot:gene25565-11215_t
MPPYGTGPVPVISTSPRAFNKDFISIRMELALTIPAEICSSISADPTPFTLAYQEQ